jgi:hypothetical protein
MVKQEKTATRGAWTIPGRSGKIKFQLVEHKCLHCKSATHGRAKRERKGLARKRKQTFMTRLLLCTVNY